MKNLLGLNLIMLLLIIQPAKAQYNTGDIELDKSLLTIEADAELDFGAFKVDISGSYNISEKKLDYLSAEVGMNAGDIYMTVELGKITQKSVDQVVEVYSKNQGKGWGVIAKELGIKPGSPEFHALKGRAKEKGNKPKKADKNKGKGKNKGGY